MQAIIAGHVFTRNLRREYELAVDASPATRVAAASGTCTARWAAIYATTSAAARSLRLQPPRPDRPAVDLTLERIKQRPVLGGLINDYERTA